MRFGEPGIFIAGWQNDKTHPEVPRTAQKAYFRKAFKIPFGSFIWQKPYDDYINCVVSLLLAVLNSDYTVTVYIVVTV